ncbi:MAG TPA: nucleoside kinase [Acholeplasmataceae bacterium]|nr:nucleoside kinase [Acholeplasmataceae bacterium]
MLKINVLGHKELQVKNHTTLLEVSKMLGIKPYAAKVNRRMRELNSRLLSDADVEFLYLNNSDAVRIYEAGLRFVVAMAIKNLYPDANVSFNYNVSRSVLAIIRNLEGGISEDVVNQIKVEVDRIVKADYPITRKLFNLEEATILYENQGNCDKVKLLQFREEEYVNLYECQGYVNYMYALMVPSTGYLTEYNMFPYGAGFIIQYPRAEANGTIPPFYHAPTFAKALRDAARWGKRTKGTAIANMNEYALNKHDLIDFVNMCEIKHTNELHELASQIVEKRNEVRLITIAGPSSSGKTTFSMRLRITLMSLGLKPVMISIDDYYKPRSEAPLDEFGQPDLEHIESLDIERFNNDISRLINGEKVTLPRYDFKRGIITDGPTISVDSDTPIIIEGIHALNDRLTSKVPRNQKYKIYIAPQTQLHIDDHNPISITDLRLLRRIVRDSKYRNAPATETMGMWPSVRRGEFRWIYPYQEGADFVFNTELSYEFGVLKRFALPQLQAIPRDSKYFIMANRLVKFLKYFVDIPEELVPCNSLLREFIGGSCFH